MNSDESHVNEAAVSNAEDDDAAIAIGLDVDEDALSYLSGADGEDYEFDSGVITSEEIGEKLRQTGSITARLSLAHFGIYASTPAALLVFSFSLFPARGLRHRFKSASLALHFHPLTSPSQLHIHKISPNEAYGPPTSSLTSHTISLGASLGAGVTGAALEPNIKTSKTYVRSERAKVRGVALGTPRATKVRWLLEENSVQKDGVPVHFEVAVLLGGCKGGFEVEVGVKTCVGWFGGVRRGAVWPLQGKGKGRIKVADVGRGDGGAGTWKGKELVDGNLDEVDLAAFTSFAEGKEG
ncbi:hypothetical protein FGG08_007001 [Glutinoglossum americanum]|uniref:Uncharacterized protein n=1 Tax=Glutinoglossum americanum TaxID=1670608 RepID=A0A9P8I2B2_9PEZI|nr:hypothetical protein FGG08_007001 [Glutinoglossum americanum]